MIINTWKLICLMSFCTTSGFCCKTLQGLKLIHQMTYNNSERTYQRHFFKLSLNSIITFTLEEAVEQQLAHFHSKLSPFFRLKDWQTHIRQTDPSVGELRSGESCSKRFNFRQVPRSSPSCTKTNIIFRFQSMNVLPLTHLSFPFKSFTYLFVIHNLFSFDTM